jgi:hypothetical protein
VTKTLNSSSRLEILALQLARLKKLRKFVTAASSKSLALLGLWSQVKMPAYGADFQRMNVARLSAAQHVIVRA